MPSTSKDVIRSFLPESWLISVGDANALFEKYRGWLPGGKWERFLRLADTRPGVSSGDNDPFLYEHYKRLGSLIVEAKAPMTARIKDGEVKIKRGNTKQVQLHIECGGIATVRTDLQAAAEYIGYHKTLRKAPYVAGVMYSELGQLAARLGFTTVEIAEEKVTPRHLLYIRAGHMTFCGLNGRHNRPENTFRPVLAYMPTAAFIEEFREPSMRAT